MQTLPGVVGINAESFSNIGHVLLESGEAGCLQVEATGFIKITVVVSQAIAQIAFMKF